MDSHVKWIRLAAWMLPTPGTVLAIILAAGLMVWAARAGALQPQHASSPRATSLDRISYQGQLLDAQQRAVTASVPMSFRLYSASQGGTALWEEFWTADRAVAVQRGLFQVMLGTYTPLPPTLAATHPELWLGVTVAGEAELTPRTQFGSVPFAMHALTIAAGTVDTAQLVDGAVTQAKAPSLLRITSTETNQGQLWKLETGTWCLAVTANNYQSTVISFTEPFAQPPLVFVEETSIGVGNASIHTSVGAMPTTTQTQVWVYSSVAQQICGKWVAIGP